MSIPKTLTKTETIALLGRSKRTIDTYMANGTLPYHYVHGPNGRQSAFKNEDVERLKRDLDTPIERAVVVREPAAIGLAAKAKEIRAPFEAGWEALATQLWKTPYPPAVYVTLKEAVKLTGLSAATIKGLGVEVRTRPYGNGVRYRRADLEKL